VLVAEGLTTVSYALDEALVAFDTALKEQVRCLCLFCQAVGNCTLACSSDIVHCLASLRQLTAECAFLEPVWKGLLHSMQQANIVPCA